MISQFLLVGRYGGMEYLSRICFLTLLEIVFACCLTVFPRLAPKGSRLLSSSGILSGGNFAVKSCFCTSKSIRCINCEEESCYHLFSTHIGLSSISATMGFAVDRLNLEVTSANTAPPHDLGFRIRKTVSFFLQFICWTKRWERLEEDPLRR